MLQTGTQLVSRTIREFVEGIVAVLPHLLSGLLFLVFAYLAIRAVRFLLRQSLERLYPTGQHLIVDFFLLVVTIFLWFGAGLAFLKIVGLGDIATSLGTAAGFVALGVSYALSNMIADAVAGVYLLRDPDYMPGDTVTTDSTTGVVKDIGLRKSRFRLDNGDTVVIANRDVEKKWTKKGSSGG